MTFTLPGFSTFKRDGLELASSFTATVNVDLKVGGLEETVTVSGQTPLVDTQNITQQKSMSKALLDTVPTSKSIFAFASLIPAAVAPTAQQDVGGSIGEQSMRLSVHGAKPGDARLLIDGLSYNSIGGTGTGRWMTINPLSTQEIVVETRLGRLRRIRRRGRDHEPDFQRMGATSSAGPCSPRARPTRCRAAISPTT